MVFSTPQIDFPLVITLIVLSFAAAKIQQKMADVKRHRRIDTDDYSDITVYQTISKTLGKRIDTNRS